MYNIILRERVRVGEYDRTRGHESRWRVGDVTGGYFQHLSAGEHIEQRLGTKSTFNKVTACD